MNGTMDLDAGKDAENTGETRARGYNPKGLVIIICYLDAICLREKPWNSKIGGN